MNIKHLTLILLLFLSYTFILSCKNDDYNIEQDLDSLNQTFKDTNYLNANDNETLEKTITLLDTTVLFFMPSNKKKQEMIKYFGTYDQYELDIVFRNFTSLFQNTKNMLKKRDIKIELTYADKFIFPLENDTIVYDLEIEDQYFGYILFDGVNMPLIKNGVQKTKDVSNDIRNYFNIKNFNTNIEEIIPEKTINENNSNEDNL